MIRRKKRYPYGGAVGIYYGITGGYSMEPYEGNPHGSVPLSEQFSDGAESGDGGGGEGGSV